MTAGRKMPCPKHFSELKLGKWSREELKPWCTSLCLESRSYLESCYINTTKERQLLSVLGNGHPRTALRHQKVRRGGAGPPKHFPGDSGVTHPPPWSLVYRQAIGEVSSGAKKSLKEEMGTSGSAKCFRYFSLEGRGREGNTTSFGIVCFI